MDDDDFDSDLVTGDMLKTMLPEIASTMFRRPDSGGIVNLGFTFHGVEFTFGPGWEDRKGVVFYRGELCVSREMDDDAADHGQFVMLDFMPDDDMAFVVREFINRY